MVGTKKARTLSLVLVGALAGAALISPVAAGPNDPATKKFARKVAKNKAKKVQKALQAQLDARTPRIAFGTSLLTVSATVTAPEGTIAEATLVAPAPGYLAIDAGGRFANFTSDDRYECVIRVDGVDVEQSRKTPAHDGAAGVNVDEDCATGAAVAVGAGAHTIQFRYASGIVGELLCCTGAFLWAIWVPHDGNGNPPVLGPAKALKVPTPSGGMGS